MLDKILMKLFKGILFRLWCKKVIVFKRRYSVTIIERIGMQDDEKLKRNIKDSLLQNLILELYDKGYIIIKQIPEYDKDITTYEAKIYVTKN